MRVLPVLMAGKNVGTANVEREGMVYLVQCKVFYDGGPLPLITLESKCGSIPCGSCIPNGQEALLTKRIPVKQWDMESGTVKAEIESESPMIQVNEGEPFAYLRELPTGIYLPGRKAIALKVK